MIYDELEKNDCDLSFDSCLAMMDDTEVDLTESTTDCNLLKNSKSNASIDLSSSSNVFDTACNLPTSDDSPLKLNKINSQQNYSKIKFFDCHISTNPTSSKSFPSFDECMEKKTLLIIIL